MPWIEQIIEKLQRKRLCTVQCNIQEKKYKKISFEIFIDYLEVLQSKTKFKIEPNAHQSKLKPLGKSVKILFSEFCISKFLPSSLGFSNVVIRLFTCKNLTMKYNGVYFGKFLKT